ncbi:MAG: nucleotidyltransferase family protein [Proteobacteria bacterium]|nr:nucleotidyltransferase family protein [Pseudomonadota bacterium]
MPDGHMPDAFSPLAPSFLPAQFLDSFVAELFSAPKRAATASALIGAPLALACLEALGPDAFARAGIEREALLKRAQIAAVCSRQARRGISELLAALDQQNIPNLAIKGFAHAYALYPAPYFRSLPDADILVPESDLGALTAILREHDFVTRTDPASDRAWGALTKASFAPVTPRDGPEFFIDFHRLVVDYPACHGVPTAEIFGAARRLETENGNLRVPGEAHIFAILALHAFRDFYEPRSLKALFDAALFMSRHAPDWSAVESMARRGKFISRTLFYRDLLAEIGIGGTEGLFAGRFLTAAGQRLVSRVAGNMRSLTLLHLPDRFKLKLEMSLYDSPLHLLRRNGERLAGLLIRRKHELPGLPIEEADA